MSELKCPFFKECGGCDYLDLSYEKEIETKKEYIKSLFKQIGYKKDIEVLKASDPYFYRNKVHVAYKLSKTGKIVSGIYEEGSKKIVTVSNCLIQNKEINKAIEVINKILQKNKILPFGYGGVLKNSLIRYGINTNELLITFVTSSEMFPGRNNVVKDIVSELKNVKTIIQNIQPRNTPIVLGEKERILYGPGFIKDNLCGLSFKITSKSFYQVNPKQTEVLYQTAIDFAGLRKDEILIDSYSGIGTIGLIASKLVRKVISVENNAVSVKYAKENATNNQIKNVEFFNQDSTKFLNDLALSKDKIDCLILDPPREGTTYEFINAISKKNIKRVVYVSCGPEALIKDLKVFESKGYVVQDIKCVDMFSRTKHVESIATLSLKR